MRLNSEHLLSWTGNAASGMTAVTAGSWMHVTLASCGGRFSLALSRASLTALESSLKGTNA